ncbi:MAG: TonB-dependent receptor, partial [Rubrivivax sp.]|nr:TonB-dependent receptor [Rubrivivax sp.]
MFKKTKIGVAAAMLVGGVSLLATAVQAQTDQRVEITGSRIKRVDVEGSLPITTISRAELDASGATTVAEFVRAIPFVTAGNFRPQGGSSAQSLAEVNLRALGAERTLVLIDGRRAAKGPMIGDRADLNTIPMAMIERVEILTDGASATYGSDAIAGVVNFITKKNFSGIEVMLGGHRPKVKGGDRNEGSVVFGATGNKGRLLGGVSYSERDIVFDRDVLFSQPRGASVYGNNYTRVIGGVDQFDFTSIAGGCTEPNFYTVGASCRYDFTQVSADEARVRNQSVFTRGDYQITDTWTGYMGAWVSRVSSFGRYAPTPGLIPLSATSPGNPLPGTDVNLYHRFAAAGPRDNSTDNNYYNLNLGITGQLFGFEVDGGYRRTDSKFYELGRNYIVRPLAQAAIDSGAYDLVNPSLNPVDVLNSIKATITRDARFKEEELYGTASIGLFKLGGNTATLLVGAEYREETFFDNYDSLQEAGVIEGSAGNSSGGSRKIGAAYGEMLLPFSKALEVSLSARWEKYSDYGNDFSPKATIRFKPMNNLALRASAGKGFRAPSLPVLTQKTTFSAEGVEDPASCAVLNPGSPECQVNTYTIANPALDSEKSTQFSFGLVFDLTDSISFKADYWSLKIEDVINNIGAQDLVDRSNGTDPRPIPAGLGVTRAPSGVITRIDAGYANEGVLKTHGIDAGVGTSFALGGAGRLRSELRWTHVLKYDEDGIDYNGSIGQPKDRMMLTNEWTMGPFRAAWNINYIGRNEFQPGSATDQRRNGGYSTHDLQFGWKTP